MLARLKQISRRHVVVALGIGFVQGLLVYFLFHELSDNDANRCWLFSARTLAVLLPITWPLIAEIVSRKHALIFTAIQGAVLAGMMAYTTSVYGADESADGPFTMILSIGVVWFMSLLLLSGYAVARRTSTSLYASLYTAKAGLAASLAYAVFFSGVLWLLLILWSELFKILGITVFHDLFFDPLFGSIVTATAIALGISVTRDCLQYGSHLFSLLRPLGRVLLPLACFIAALFLLALPFTGLKPIWDTRHATPLMVSLQLFVLLLTIAAYDSGQEKLSYPQAIKKLVSVALAALPVYTILAAYSLGLRIDQYGWTVDRVWGAMMIAVPGYAAFGYAYGVLRSRAPWLSGIEKINIQIAWLVLSLAFLTTTPILNPARITVSSQVSMLMSGRITADKFDFTYLRFELGTYGRRALERLKDVKDITGAEAIRTQAEEALAKNERYQRPKPIQSKEILLRQLTVFPAGTQLPDDFVDYLMTKQADAMSGCSNFPEGCVLLAADLNGDGVAEYTMASYSYSVFMQVDGAWEHVARMQYEYGFTPAEMLKNLKEHGFTTDTPEWKDIVINGQRLTVFTENAYKRKIRAKSKPKTPKE